MQEDRHRLVVTQRSRDLESLLPALDREIDVAEHVRHAAVDAEAANENRLRDRSVVGEQRRGHVGPLLRAARGPEVLEGDEELDPELALAAFECPGECCPHVVAL